MAESEAEALILECNLIKKNMPKFNVLLKDDKTYPYIKVNVKADYPDLYITRRVLNDGAKYFGPYPSASATLGLRLLLLTRLQYIQNGQSRKPYFQYAWFLRFCEYTKMKKVASPFQKNKSMV